MKKLVAVLIFIIIVSPASASLLPKFPFIFAEGEAEVELAPNEAHVSFQVKAYDPIAAKALETVHIRSKELIAFFSEQKIRKEDIESYEIEKTTVALHRAANA